ncbi:MAG: N-acetylmuramoyl-L-alanine amidase [candidate division WOR-3 bacterium]
MKTFSSGTPLLFILFFLSAFARTIPVGNKLIETTKIKEIEYVSASKVVTALKGNIWQSANKWIAIVPDTSTELNSELTSEQRSHRPKKEVEIVLTPNHDTIIVNHRLVPSPFPIKVIDDDLMVPVFVLGEIFPLPKPSVPKIKSITLTQNKDTTILKIEVPPSVLYETEVLSSLEYHLYLPALSEIKEIRPKGIVKNIVIENKSGTNIALYFNRPCNQKITKSSDALFLLCYPRPQKRLTTIVLDPGHGGKDPGAIGRGGLKEKTVNLGIALRLKNKLEALGLKVLLTRTDDCYVSLADRVRFARHSKADLFISIHCNAAVRDKRKRGLETYFLSDAKTDWERAVAARENAAIEFEIADTNPIVNNDLSLILSDLAQNEFLLESQELAALIQENTAYATGIPNRGVMQAGFYVLRVNFMPAVLVECGYISNPAEEKLLAKKEFWEKLAKGIATGIKKFIDEVEKRYAQK